MSIRRGCATYCPNCGERIIGGTTLPGCLQCWFALPAGLRELWRYPNQIGGHREAIDVIHQWWADAWWAQVQEAKK